MPKQLFKIIYLQFESINYWGFSGVWVMYLRNQWAHFLNIKIQIIIYTFYAKTKTKVSPVCILNESPTI